MLTTIRHTAVLVLGCLLLAVVMAACGGGPSEADIEAAVQARLQEKQAEDVALEAKAQAMAKAMAEATAQAAPTATPLPPTPTSTLTPTPTAIPTLLTETYIHEMSGFSIAYPSNWTVREWMEESTPHVEIEHPLGSHVRIVIEYTPSVTLEEFVAVYG